MASVEVSKLSSQEVAELACTYAALILHDDDQEITGTFDVTQEKRSANSSVLPILSWKPTGPSCSQRLFRAKTSVPFLTSEELPLAPLPLLPPLLLKKLLTNLRRKTKRRKPLLPHQRKKKRRWIWETSLADCLSDA